MKKSFTLITKISVVAFVSAAFFFNMHIPSRRGNEMKEEGKGSAEKEDANGAANYILKLKGNPLTGRIEANDVLAMRHQADMHSGNSNARMAGNTTLTWNERGPNNVGGRTRAFLIDKTNPQKMFAGSVAGGLWVSVNGGESWSPVNDQLQNLAVDCITQAANGDIYFGTGEMFYYNTAQASGGLIGHGIYKSTDGGLTFTALPATVPTATFVAGGVWTNIGEMAASPTDPNRIYASTNGGLRVSSDGGSTWTNPITGAGSGSQSRDVCVAPSDGTVYAFVGNFLYISSTGDVGSFTKMVSFPTTISGSGTIDRAEIAVSPTSSSTVYVSGANGGGTIYGIFQSLDKGLNWTQIAYSGTSFQPYASQGPYDQAIAVDPSDPGRIFIAGLEVYSWSQPDGWRHLSLWNDNVFDQYYVHADIHVIRFHPTDPNTAFITNDGGIFRSTNMGSPQPGFKEMNKNYKTTQLYSVAFSSDDKIVFGGMQDNGSWMVDGTGNTALSGKKVNGGDGGDAAMSMINTKALFHGNPGDGAGTGNAAVYRSSNLGSSSGQFWSERLADANAAFVTPFRLWESFDDTRSADSIDFVADPLSSQIGLGTGTKTNFTSSITPNQPAAHIVPGSIRITSGSLLVTDDGAGNLIGNVSPSGHNTVDYSFGSAALNVTFSSPPASGAPVFLQFDPHYDAGAELVLKSANNNFIFSGILTGALNAHEVQPFQDIVQANFVTCLSTGVWFTKAALRFESNAKWFLIDSALSNVKAFEFSPDGNVLFCGTDDGHIYRITNLSSIKSKQDTLIPLYNLHRSGQVQVQLIASLGSIITSIAVNQYNGNNIVATLGNYGVKNHVFRCIDALSTVPTFTAIHGSGLTALPDSMPVYASVIDISNPDRIILGTELGIWMSEDKGATWSEQNTGMARVATFMMRQQTQPPWMVTNTGVIYIGTHGRGMFSCSNFLVPLSAKDSPIVKTLASGSGIVAYPNPSTDRTLLTFNLDKKKDISLSVWNIQGKLMYSETLSSLKAGENKVDLDVTDFSNGTYFVRLAGDGVKSTSKIVVLK